MQPFAKLDAVACPLGLANVDTDQLLPARFMVRPRKDGYGGFLLYDMRFTSGDASSGFVLDDARYKGAGILVARRNFGTGSSREAAVYALADFGIRCVIAPSFGDIFAANAVKNGVLPATISEDDTERLLARLGADPQLTIDLESKEIRAGATTIAFAIDPVRRQQLLNGWDDLDLTLQHEAAIKEFRARQVARPWNWPRA